MKVPVLAPDGLYVETWVLKTGKDGRVYTEHRVDKVTSLRVTKVSGGEAEVIFVDGAF